MKAILCLGDSITFGIGEYPPHGWVGRLQKSWATVPLRGVYNLGVPGQTSEELLKRFDVECNARLRFKHPGDSYLIFVAIGTNDAKPEYGLSAKEFEKNILGIIKKAKSCEAKCAFFGLPPVDEQVLHELRFSSWTNEKVKEFNDVIKRCCTQEKVPFLDIYSLMYAREFKKLLADGLHPNKKGYDFMFENIEAFLKKEKLLKF